MPFSNKKLTLDGFLVTDTPLDKITGAERMNWGALEDAFKVLHHDGAHVERVLKVS